MKTDVLLAPIFRASLVVVLMICAAAVFALAQDKNLSAEEILARHLRSFGSAEAIAKSQNRMAIGSVQASNFSPPRVVSGKAELSSNGVDFRLIAIFDNAGYPMERIGLFDNKVTIRLDQARQSPLDDFLSFFDKPLIARVFGGSILSTWALYKNNPDDVQVEVDGKRKLGDREAWVIKMRPKNGLGTGTYIKLYFDAKDFRHMRTVYQVEDGNLGIPRGASSRALNYRGATVIEDFEDFRSDADGITLPHKYSVLLSANAEDVYKLVVTINEYKLVNFPANFFSFQK